MTLAFITSLPLIFSSVQESQLDASRLLEDFRAAAQRYESTHRTIYIEGKYKDHEKVEGKNQFRDMSIRYVRAETCQSMEESYYLNESEFFDRAIIDCGTRQYVLRRTAPTKDYYLEFKVLGKPFITMLQNTRNTIVSAPYALGAKEEFMGYIKSDNFKFTKARLIGTSSEAQVIEASFEFDPHDPTKPWSVEGTVKLDVTRDLAILDCVMKANNKRDPSKPTLSHLTIKYKEGTNSVAPQSIEFHNIKLPNGKYRINSLFIISRWDVGKVSSEEFTLDHYGLGDLVKPIGASRTKYTAAYWASGLVCVVLLVILARYVLIYKNTNK